MNGRAVTRRGSQPSSTRPRSRFAIVTRRTLALVGTLLAIAAIWFATDFAYVSVGAESDYAAKADAILVLGCNIVGDNGPSPCIRARAGHAAELYLQGYAPVVIASGGPVPNGPTEASILQMVLESNGVPPQDIVQEDRSLNTIQNVYNTRAIMQSHGWHSVVLVTEPFHINRATLIARDAGLTVYPSPAVNSSNWQGILRPYNLTRDTLSLMFYQLKSLVGQRS